MTYRPPHQSARVRAAALWDEGDVRDDAELAAVLGVTISQKGGEMITILDVILGLLLIGIVICILALNFGLREPEAGGDD